MDESEAAKNLLKPGSHDGRELELMLRGIKPMSMFIAHDVVAPEFVGDAQFEPYVSQGRILKFVYRNDELKMERRCYCLPTEEWRGKLSNFLFELSCERDLMGIFTPDDLGRIEGILLGYQKESTEEHLRHLRLRYAKRRR